jgi:hypothetical protein
MFSRVEKTRLGSAPMQRQFRTLILTLLTVASATLSAAPVGYSINSDSGTSEPDSLYSIDMATGQVIAEIGIVHSTPLDSGRRLDVEGLAFASDGTLYGIDDQALKLFRINPLTALVDTNHDYNITGAGLVPKDNDFGMTFACDGNLYVTSVVKNALFKVDATNGTASLVGALGQSDLKISALAAYGDPVRLFGLSNGTAGVNAVGPPRLYEINASTGLATEIGLLGNSVGSYAEGGLAFDEAGQLWAITDRSTELQPSQVMRINTSTGAASEVRTTTEQGFESLAITGPRGCTPVGSGESATFLVQKRFEDNNNLTPVKLNIKCNTGIPLENSLTVLPNPGDFGQYEVAFIVEDFAGGALDCQIWEETPVGYSADYDCQSGSACSTNSGNGPCSFAGVNIGQEDLCLIQNRLDPVEVTVISQWLFERENLFPDDQVTVALICSGAFGGDGASEDNGQMRWSWVFDSNPAIEVATIYPDFAGTTQCWTEVQAQVTAVEPVSTCSEPISIAVGDTAKSCTVTSTVFFEGIPTLNPYGLALISALMLLTGLISARRIV